MRTFGLVLAASLLITTQVFGAVWNAERSWNADWQKKYSNWITTSVGPAFFKELGSPYKELPLDCADAQYALKAYFSFINKLEFAVNNGKLTQATPQFDHYGGPNKRVAALIHFLANSYGTESLAHQDTYPIAIKDVRPGDIYMYKVSDNGNYTRHTYIVKNINIDGTFDVMYSTQARRDAGKPLTREKSYIFTKSPTNTGVDKNHWGFRRSKMPQHASISQENLPLSDFSQYDLARSVSSLEFSREIKRIHQTVSESSNMVIRRNFNSVCSSVQDRVSVVKSAIDYTAQIGGRCMNEKEYDTYSTPSRDSSIMDLYQHFTADYNEILETGVDDEVERDLLSLSHLILSNRSLESHESSQIFVSCPVHTTAGSVDLGTFRRDLASGQVSFHPNDNVYLRWGFAHQGGRNTSCHTYYGYPSN